MDCALTEDYKFHCLFLGLNKILEYHLNYQQFKKIEIFKIDEKYNVLYSNSLETNYSP